METHAVVMARLDRAIQEHKAQHHNVMLEGRVKPGHDNRDSIEARPALAHIPG
jgi:hypothetical protein